MKGELTPELIIMVTIILLSQSIFLFINAKRNQHNYWLWGILGLIQAPVPTLVYLIFVRKIWQKNN
ncbi:sigma-Y antisigma factor component [Bacillus sp. CGMCC 1.16607]|uniref:sigma-Y antisigma factor component n=1 Tax=Bacillus sp. CGMCC 1.16607 TaxID=3351842 RepID=UPI0036372FCD